MNFIHVTQIMLFRFRFLSQRPNNVNELARDSAVFSKHSHQLQVRPVHTRVLHSDILFYRISLIPILLEREMNSSGAVLSPIFNFCS